MIHILVNAIVRAETALPPPPFNGTVIDSQRPNPLKVPNSGGPEFGEVGGEQHQQGDEKMQLLLQSNKRVLEALTRMRCVIPTLPSSAGGDSEVRLLILAYSGDTNLTFMTYTLNIVASQGRGAAGGVRRVSRRS